MQKLKKLKNWFRMEKDEKKCKMCGIKGELLEHHKRMQESGSE